MARLLTLQHIYIGARAPPQLLKKRSENAWANETISCGFPSIPGIAPGVAPRVVVFVLLKSCDAIPRMEFRIPRMEFQIPRAAPRILRNSPRAPSMGLFTPREFGVVPRLLNNNRNNDNDENNNNIAKQINRIIDPQSTNVPVEIIIIIIVIIIINAVRVATIVEVTIRPQRTRPLTATARLQS